MTQLSSLRAARAKLLAAEAEHEKLMTEICQRGGKTLEEMR